MQTEAWERRVKTNKTSKTYGDAHLVVDKEVEGLMSQIKRWRPTPEGEDYFFLTSNGRQMTSSTVCQDLERCGQLVGWNRPESATSLRQFAATVISKYPETVRKTVAGHMFHSQATQEKYHILQQKEDQAREAYSLLNVARGSTTKTARPALPATEAPTAQDSTEAEDKTPSTAIYASKRKAGWTAQEEGQPRKLFGPAIGSSLRMSAIRESVGNLLNNSTIQQIRDKIKVMKK
ncbi:uncharacterized protein LOC110455518 [Mizuhopecten yessoensis]|uniref:uncharacterized protein LOC110455518 n=1 Tax=Mizuhopecten yessoensis TaxID=6573 RepID=UPI000B45B43F|nr:uncharacterized protein LOC110455518 [Mizuhopecten yessoensis]